LTTFWESFIGYLYRPNDDDLDQFVNKPKKAAVAAKVATVAPAQSSSQQQQVLIVIMRMKGVLTTLLENE
jgi:hypothetical protein